MTTTEKLARARAGWRRANEFAEEARGLAWRASSDRKLAARAARAYVREQQAAEKWASVASDLGEHRSEARALAAADQAAVFESYWWGQA